MSIFKPSTSRRREVRKTLPRQRAAMRQMLTLSQVVLGVMLAVGFAAFATVILLTSRGEPPFRPGQLVDKPQIARVKFQSVDLAATKQAREKIEREAAAIYEPNGAFFEQTRQSLLTLPEKIAAHEAVEQVPAIVRDKFGLNETAVEAFETLKLFERNGKSTDDWNAMIGRFMAQLSFQAILSETEYQEEKDSLSKGIIVQLAEAQSMPVSDDDIVNIKDVREIRHRLNASPVIGVFPEPLRPIVVGFVLNTLAPTYKKNTQLTESARIELASVVQPIQVVYVPGQVLVAAGQVLDASGYRLLKEHIAAQPMRARLLGHAGGAVLVLLAVAMGVVGVLGIRPRVAQNPMRGFSLAALLLASLMLAWAFRPLSEYGDPAVAIGSTMLAAVILAIAYDRWFASATIGVYGAILALVLNLHIAMYLAVIAACVTAIAQLREVRQRGTLIRMGLVAGLVAAVGIFAAELASRNHVDDLYRFAATEAAIGALAALFVGFFALGVLPFIEKFFKVTTSMTLLELGDMNHPVLRRLAQAAPGTFNHSLQVATLCESAAEAIGANSLLARVGAYYHDIGKIHKPQYFVENQVGGVNPHEKVSPAMSLLIIVGHVKNGVEMAREYKLPPAIQHFIESHHGTTLAEYFYHAARKDKTEEESPEEFEYRYPGPKPQTREAAILMICDAIESASRAMAEPTAARIEALVHTITSKRLMDGQFDQCDITLAELHQLEQAITKSLIAIYHGRIAYPELRQPDRKPKDRAAAV
jgi:putative nucleotidyltransferase with HDIG domain